MGCIVTMHVVYVCPRLVRTVNVAQACAVRKALLFPLATTTTVSSNRNDPNWCNRSLFRSRRLLCRSEMWYVHSEATWALAKYSPRTSRLIDVNGMLNKTTRTRRRGVLWKMYCDKHRWSLLLERWAGWSTCWCVLVLFLNG